MGPDFMARAQSHAEEIRSIRERIHRHPELGNQEFETAKTIEQCLDAWGIPHRRVLDTAVVARVDGALPGRCAALRADMDALPIREETGCPFASEVPGVMHACGHDVHVAAALGAARILSECRDALPGSVVFLFQPDEEGYGGAARMAAAGALESVNAVFGAHVSPELPEGRMAVRYGKFYAAADLIHVVVHGRSAHGAERENGIDALGAAARMVTELLRLPEEEPDRCVLTVGEFHSGTVRNIVADRAEFDGILRTLGPEARERMRGKVAQTVADIAGQWGATAECDLPQSYPGVVNDDAMTRLVEEAAQDLLGVENVCRIPIPTMTTEDFGMLLADRPGSYYHIGAGCDRPLHNSGFLPSADAPVIGAALHSAVLWHYLTLPAGREDEEI